MDTGFEYMDELIAKALANEAGAEELAMLRNWRAESADHENYYLESEKIFTAISDLKIEHSVNTDAAWDKLTTKFNSGEARIIPFYKRRVVLRAAASIILLMMLTIISRWFMEEEAVKPLVLKALKKTEQTTLPDGSKVFMNRNSELSYAMNAKGERKVTLKGEAFFEVVHDEEKPFIITVNEVMIKDIGTAFNVKAFPENNTIEVVVESGEVQFYSPSNAGLSLVKGEKAIYDKSSGHFTKMLPVPTENTNSYRSKQFEFKETLLKEVVEQLNSVYPVTIKLQDKELENLRLSVLFNNEEPEDIVEIIADTFGLEIEKKDGLIILKQKKQTQ